MPQTQQALLFGNTPETIYECLLFLQTVNLQQYEISIVYNTDQGLAYIGEDLDLVDPETYKVHKKRWWEFKECFNQLKLPFYSPAKIISITTTRQETAFKLKLEHNITIHYNTYRSLEGIKAIKIHLI